MFLDYVTLMLINMVGGLVILAWYVYTGMIDPDQKRWAPAFAIPGLLGLLCGIHMTWTWPLPGSYNVAYGEMSILLSILFLSAALALSKGWDLRIIAIYGFFAGLAAVIVGIRFIDLKMTNNPIVSGVGFILTGMCGICALPTLNHRQNRAIRFLGFLVIMSAALIWAYTGYSAYWGHLSSFTAYQPAPLTP